MFPLFIISFIIMKFILSSKTSKNLSSGLSDSFPSTILAKQVENKNWKIFTDQLQKLISYEFLEEQELWTAL